MDEEERDEAISIYFHMGLLYKDIVRILALEHGLVISIRQLKRITRKNGLFRRKNYSNIADVVNFVYNQIQTSGKLHGYRWMYEKCPAYGLKVKKEDVRTILSILDPQATEQRRKRRLKRRQYSSKGTNYMWHFDGYDKLKRYGICISGCVDGFSRKVVWMNAYRTNSDPKIIGGYFMEAVDKLSGCPRIIRGDMGTENVYVRDLQRFLRMDDGDGLAGASCYREGASTANQRIENWWSFLRRECMDYWIDLFRNLLNVGNFNGDFIDTNLVRFCFMDLVQDDLDQTVDTWNRHLIRRSRNSRGPFGRPLIMYHMPELYGTTDYLSAQSSRKIEICKTECTFRERIPCDKDMFDLCCILIQENGYDLPSDSESALLLYEHLRREVRNVLL